MEQLIIQALKSACGNKNIKFQVILQGKELHIYANHRQDYHPNYSILEENVGAAIASLNFAEIECFWLYGRPLGQIEPNWRVLLELSPQDHQEIDDITVDLRDLGDLAKDIERDVEDIGNFNLPTNGTTGDARLLLDNWQHLALLEEDSQLSADSGNFDLPTNGTTGNTRLLLDTNRQHQKHQILPQEDNLLSDVSSFTQSNSSGDTGLLQDHGLIHGQPLKEEEINNFSPNSTQLTAATETTAVGVQKKLVQYCFINNRNLLTEKALPPNKQVMRLVKFFHYLSSKDQQQLAAILENYFRLGVIDPQGEILPASQNWLTKISTLDYEEHTVLALWLSRYCFDPQATLAEFESISLQNSAQMKIKTAHSLRQESLVSVEEDALEPAIIEANIQARKKIKLEQDQISQAKFLFPSWVKKLLLPGIWILLTIILIFLGIMNQHFQNKTTASQIPAVCNQTIGSPEYCRLAVNLAGEKAISQASESLFPLTEITESIATYGCGRYANLKAGVPIDKIAPEITPVISSHGEKIFQHIFVVEALQNNAKQPGKTKVGCVYTTGTAERSPKTLAADLIPLNWLEQPNQTDSKGNNQLALGIFTKPVNLGISTIFAALGLAIASSLHLGLKIKHSQTIYLVALMLGMAQLITSLLPSWGVLGTIMLPLATLLMAAVLVKDFQLNWQLGYPIIAVSVLLILAIEFLGSSLCLELISSLV